ncbi:hypothetical protein FQA39_LY07454 [Lamprigera yunnana]|nr:hypothetical protein FQA39_LY07454 [Lamprigera yunnana]
MLLHVTKWLEKRHLNFYHLKMRNTKDVNSEILFILANIKHSDDESSSSHQSEKSVPVQHQHIQEWDNVGDNRTIFQNENRNASTLHKQLIVFRNIECLLAEQTVQMNSIEQRLERIENIVAGKFDGLTNTAQDDSVLTTLLPLNSLEGLNTFDILLSTHVDMALKFVGIFCNI